MATKVRVDLFLGTAEAKPAPLLIAQAFQSVTVTQKDRNISTFQLSLNIDRKNVQSADYSLLDIEELKPNSRVIISVLVNAEPTVLFDGFINNIEMNYANESGTATLSLTGEDILSRMNLKEKTADYQSMTVTDIIKKCLGDYSDYGLAPEIKKIDLPVWEPDEHTIIQNGTDLALIQYYANKLGYIFRVRPTKPNKNNFYFGPPETENKAEQALNVNMGFATNVDDINLIYDAGLAQLVTGFVNNEDLEGDPIAVSALDANRKVAMAKDDPITTNGDHVHSRLFKSATYNSATGLDYANQTTTRSTDKVLSGTISVDTLRYGQVIEVPSVVIVRGAGASANGKYYVSQVQHSISEGKYQQLISVQREGFGSTVTKV